MTTQRLSVRALWGLAGWALPLVAVFLLTPTLLAAAGQSRFGILMICFVTPLMAAQFDFGIAASAMRRFAAALSIGRIPVHSLATFGLPQLLIGITLGGLVIALARWISKTIGFDEVLGSDEGSRLVRLCGLWVAAAVGLSLPMIVARAAQLLSWASFVQTISTLFLWIGAVYALHTGRPLHDVVGMGIFLQIAGAMLTALVVRHRIAWNGPLLPRSTVRAADFKFSAGMFASQLAGIVVYQGDRILVSTFGSPAMAGSYALCTNLANKLLGAVASLTSFVFPHASSLLEHHGSDAVGELLHALDRAIVVLTAPLLVLMLCLAEPFFTLWLRGLGDPKVVAAFRLLAIAFTTTALIVPVSHVLAATGETLLGAKFAWLTAVVASATIIFLVPSWGIIGAATGMLLAMSTSLIFGYAARRRLRIRPAQDAAAMRRGVLLGSIVEVGVLVAGWQFVWSWPGLLAVGSAAWVTFYATRAAFGLLSPEELRLVKRGIARFVPARAAAAPTFGGLARPATIAMRSAAETDHEPEDGEVRARSYEYRTTMAEIAHLEAIAAGRRHLTTTSVRSLRSRPHVVRLLESRFGFVSLGLLDWTARAFSRFMRGIRHFHRRALVRAPVLTDPQPSHPQLADGPFNQAILTKRPTLLLDVTPTFWQPTVSGGIPRSVRALARAGVETGLALPVVIKNGQLHSYYAHSALEGPIHFMQGDVYALVDVYWYHLQEYSRAIEVARSSGAKIALLLYDIFPLLHPCLYPAEVPQAFESGLLRFLAASDYCVSISKSTQEDIIEYLGEVNFPQRSHLQFGHFHLGLNPEMAAEGEVRPQMATVLAPEPMFLAVGTVEPRKGYSVALDACDLAWARGEDFRFVIIGRYGWRSLAIRDRILNHPELNRRLFWYSDASDRELSLAYSRCVALIQCSVAEGFGLPLLEAAYMGAPVIASDLPVFKEIGQSKLTYFEVGSAEALAGAIQHHLSTRPSSSAPQWTTWTDALHAFAACLIDQATDSEYKRDQTEPDASTSEATVRT